jgi:uncharacterized membrane protein
VRSQVLRAAFITASVAWVLMLPLAPLVAGRPHASTVSAAFALAVYAVGSMICHQLPERSYRLFGAQMPVCARCTGIYLGAAVAAVLAAPGASAAAGLATRTLRLVLVAAAVPTALTLVFEWTTGVTPSNTVRLAAGVPIGAAIAWAVVRHAYDTDVARRGAAGG